VRTPKGSGSRKAVWRRARRKERTSSTAASMFSTPPAAWAEIWRDSLAERKFLR